MSRLGPYTRSWDGGPCGPNELGELLVYNGFHVEIEPYSPGQGLFWARRLDGSSNGAN